MSFLFLSAGALFIAWIVHLAIWRWRLLQAQLKALLVIFAVVWAVAVLLVLMGFFSAGYFVAGWLVGFLYFCLFYWSTALCYVITYSAMEGYSPTLNLTRHLHLRGEEGVSHEEIEEFFRQRPIVGAQTNAQVTD